MENTSKSTPVVLKGFPNGNSIVGPKVLEYANRYQTFLNKTAESILSLTETVYEAHTKLSFEEFEQFKEEVGLKSKSTLSKFIAIGKNVSRLKPIEDRLPHSWTTLYRLVQLKQFQFDCVADILTVETTTSDILKVLGRHPTNVIKVNPDIKLYLSNLTKLEKLELVKELKVLLKGYKVIINISQDFSNEIQELNKKQAA